MTFAPPPNAPRAVLFSCMPCCLDVYGVTVTRALRLEGVVSVYRAEGIPVYV